MVYAHIFLNVPFPLLRRTLKDHVIVNVLRQKVNRKRQNVKQVISIETKKQIVDYIETCDKTIKDVLQIKKDYIYYDKMIPHLKSIQTKITKGII